MIKKVKIENLDEIVCLAKEIFGKFCWTKKQFEDEINNDTSNFYCIFEKKSIIGYIVFSHSFENVDLLDIGIKEYYRQKGYGKKLMSVMFKYCIKNKVDNIMLEVDANNQTALFFYNNFGFSIISTRKNYYQNGNNAIIMSLNIKEKMFKIKKYFNFIYPNADTELNFSNNFELLVSVILSAQCTDKRVNAVTKNLFKKYKTPEDFLKLGQDKLEKEIYSCGFYHNKAKSIINTCKDLINLYNSQVPNNFEDLISLSGVGQKTANVVYAVGFNKPAFAVDTHVSRVAKRLGLSYEIEPTKIEKDLCEIFSIDEWKLLHHQMIMFGRYFCKSQNPKCQNCNLKEMCLYQRKVLSNKKEK